MAIISRFFLAWQLSKKKRLKTYFSFDLQRKMFIILLLLIKRDGAWALYQSYLKGERYEAAINSCGGNNFVSGYSFGFSKHDHIL
jgi:hypothetical protein